MLYKQKVSETTLKKDTAQSLLTFNFIELLKLKNIS